MKRIILLMTCAFIALTASAQQEVDVYENGSLSAKYINKTGNTVKVVFKEYDIHITYGKFSVSASKKVKFSKGNLYWDGSNYHLESAQTSYPTTWSTSHVGHFFWTNLTDYQTGTAKYMPYNNSYDYTSAKASDKFFCGEDNKLTVDGTAKLYALSKTEWTYLLKSRTNASSLRKYGVTVDGKANCMIIAPDDYDYTANPLKSSYTLDEINNLDLVCLPAAGNRDGTTFDDAGTTGYYWSSTGRDQRLGIGCYAYLVYITSSSYSTDNEWMRRGLGRSIRLVKDSEDE